MSAISLTAYLGTTGLSDVGYRFIDATGAFTGTRQTTGVYELAGSRGIYGINTPTIPGDAVRVYWDSTGTAAVYAYETLDLYLSNYLNGNNETITGNVLCSVFTASTAFNALVFNAVTWNSNTAVNLGQITATNASNDIRGVLLTGTQTFSNTGTWTGDITGNVGNVLAISANAVDASALATDAVTKIAAGIWNALTSGLTTAGSIGKRLVDFVTTLVYSAAPTAAAIDTQLSGTHGAGPWGAGGSGSGAYVVTVTVVDGSAVPLQNALVRLHEGINSFTALTDASGIATFSLDAATYIRSINKDGYQFTPDTIIVTTDGNFDAVMTAVVAPSPSAPNLATVTGTILAGSGVVVANAKGHMSLKAGPGKHRPLITSGNTLATSEVDFVTNGSGVVKAADGTSTLEVVRTNYVTQTDSTDANAYWEIDFPDIGVKGRAVYIASPSFDMSSIAAP